MIVGFQFSVGTNVVAAHRFERSLSLGSSFLEKTTANAQQISVHVRNDKKSQNLEQAGQLYCQVTDAMLPGCER